MTFFLSLFFNFLSVFFVDRIIPGIEISYFENVPNIGADFFFALIVGGGNALISPLLLTLKMSASLIQISIFSFVISFGSFIIIYFLHLGVVATNFEGVFVGGSIVWGVSVITNTLYKARFSNPSK